MGGNILDSRLHTLCTGMTGSTPVPSTNLYAVLAQIVRALGWTRRKPREVVSATLTCRTNL